MDAGNRKKPRELYERDILYRYSKLLSDRVWDMVQRWGPHEREEVGEGLLRSSDSLATNVAKAAADCGTEHRLRFVKDARSSLFEIKHWLKRAFRSGFISEKETDELLVMLEKIEPQIKGAIARLETRMRFGG